MKISKQIFYFCIVIISMPFTLLGKGGDFIDTKTKLHADGSKYWELYRNGEKIGLIISREKKIKLTIKQLIESKDGKHNRTILHVGLGDKQIIKIDSDDLKNDEFIIVIVAYKGGEVIKIPRGKMKGKEERIAPMKDDTEEGQ